MTPEQENLIKSLVYEKTGYIPLEIKISNLTKNLGLLNTKYYCSNFFYEKIKILCEMYILCLKSLSTNLETLRKEIFIKNDKDYLVTRAHLMFDIRNCIDLQSQTPSDKYRLDVSLYNLMENIEYNAKNLGYKFFVYLKLMIEEMR
nr:MAG TPA: hypothetical protein [Caudoviricetes sp.]